MKNSNRYYPSEECMFCKKAINETGGKRIIAKHILSIGLSGKYLGGGNPEYPNISVEIVNGLYAVFRGPKSKLTNELKNYILNEFRGERHPWFCQICGNQICHVCGSPAEYVHGCDVLYNDGRIMHFAILPIPPSCINTTCECYRK